MAAVAKIITLDALGRFKTNLESIIEEIIAEMINVPEEDVGGNIWIEAGDSS